MHACANRIDRVSWFRCHHLEPYPKEIYLSIIICNHFHFSHLDVFLRTPMKPITGAQLFKLHTKVKGLLEQLNTTDLLVRKNVPHYYYLLKERELELMLHHFSLAVDYMGQHRINLFYAEIFTAWRKDVRWLAQHHRSRKRPIL
jgi:hypothetical protein